MSTSIAFSRNATSQSERNARNLRTSSRLLSRLSGHEQAPGDDRHQHPLDQVEGESNPDHPRAGRYEMDNRLAKPRIEHKHGETIGDLVSATNKGDDNQRTENRQCLITVRVSPAQPFREGRYVGTARIERLRHNGRCAISSPSKACGEVTSCTR